MASGSLQFNQCVFAGFFDWFEVGMMISSKSDYSSTLNPESQAHGAECVGLGAWIGTMFAKD